MPRPLSVVADLSLEPPDGSTIRIAADADRVTVYLADFQTARKQSGPFRNKARRVSALNQLHQGLQASGLTLDIMVRQHRVACLDPDSRGSWLSRWLGLGPTTIFPLGILRAMLAR